MKASEPIPVRECLNRRVQVVAGKGGVGRTVVSCAIALRSARDGARTLLLEVNAPDSAAEYLGSRPAVDEPREVLNNLWLCRMTPAGSLSEYALMVLRFKALYSLVFENRLVKYLLRSIPSLGEFTMLGKAWYHTTETLPGGAPRFERIIIDAPATGHAITFLSVARTVAEVSPKGIMKTAARRVAEMVESKTNTCMHVVCLPEEMPVNEGLDLLTAGRSKLRMTPGVGLVNRMLPPIVHEDDRSVMEALNARADSDHALKPYVAAATRRVARERLQHEYAERFKNEGRLSTLEIPDFGSSEVTREWLDGVIAVLDAAASGAPALRKASDG